MRIHRVPAALGGAALALTLAACGASDEGSATASGSTASESSASAADGTDAADEAGSVTGVDLWVKAAKKGGMTSVFGTLENDGNADVVVASASSPVSSSVEMHTTTQNADGSSSMQQMEGGFTVPAGDSHELEPGGDHLMLMGLSKAVQPGERVGVELELDDGSTATVEAIVKDFAGAEENYQGDDDGDADESEMDHSDMDHGDMDHGDMDHS